MILIHHELGDHLLVKTTVSIFDLVTVTTVTKKCIPRIGKDTIIDLVTATILT